MTIKDQFGQAPQKDRTLIVAAIVVVILIVGGILIWLANSSKERELQPWGHTQGDFVGLIERAYGEDSNHTHYDEQVNYHIGLAKQGCEDLRLQRNIDFYNLSTNNTRDRLTVTAGVLVFCPELQDRAIEYGLTESDYEKFPLK